MLIVCVCRQIISVMCVYLMFVQIETLAGELQVLNEQLATIGNEKMTLVTYSF